MRGKFLLLIISIVGLTQTVLGQQEAQFSQFMFNAMSINPGYAGANGAICLNAFARQQWMGFKDPDGTNTSPQTLLFSIDAPVKFLRGGLGAVISKDKLGYEDNTNVRLAYAYRTPIGNGFLGIGIEAAFLDKKIDFTKFIAIDPGDPVLNGKAKESEFFTDYAFGVYYNQPGKFYVGFSALNLSEPKGFDYRDLNNTSKLSFSLKRTYFLQGGYEYVFPSNPSFQLDPHILVKTDFVSAQYDIAAILKYENRFWGGLSYRVQDAATVLLGVNWMNFKFGYSYDITTSSMGGSGKSSGSHEIFARYCFTIEIPKVYKSYKNTRYL